MPRNQKAKGKAQKARGKPPAVRGRGDYRVQLAKYVPKGTFAKGGQAAGGALGGAAGTAIGGPALGAAGALIGQELGRRAGSALAQVAGFGDYHVRENSLLGAGFRVPNDMAVPQFINTKGPARVQHREYVCDIIAPSSPLDFNNTSYRINPADPSLFPWLSRIAARFSQYRMRGLIVEFKSGSSDITAGGALGMVMLATNYNALDTAFESKVEMENCEFAVSAKPSITQLHAVECARGSSVTDLLFTRSALAGTTDDDPRLYDLGTFQLATVGLPATVGQVLGELWVTYDVELLKPVLRPPPDIGQVTALTSISKTTPLGATQTVRGDLLTVLSSTTLSIDVTGEYRLLIYCDGPTSGSLTTSYSGVHTAATIIGGSSVKEERVKCDAGCVLTLDFSTTNSVTACHVEMYAFPYTW